MPQRAQACKLSGSSPPPHTPQRISLSGTEEGISCEEDFLLAFGEVPEGEVEVDAAGLVATGLAGSGLLSKFDTALDFDGLAGTFFMCIAGGGGVFTAAGGDGLLRGCLIPVVE